MLLFASLLSVLAMYPQTMLPSVPLLLLGTLPNHLSRGQDLLLVPAQTPSEPLSAVALAQLDQADKGPKDTRM